MIVKQGLLFWIIIWVNFNDMPSTMAYKPQLKTHIKILITVLKLGFLTSRQIWNQPHRKGKNNLNNNNNAT